MPITLDEIIEETRDMPGEIVAELIDRIMVARHGGIERPWLKSWKLKPTGASQKSNREKSKAFLPKKFPLASRKSQAVKLHIFHPEADEEYVHAVRYYADIRS